MSENQSGQLPKEILKNQTIAMTKECLKFNKHHINFLKYPLFAGTSKQSSLALSIHQNYKFESTADYHMVKISAECIQKFIKEGDSVFGIKVSEMPEFIKQIEYPLKFHEQLIVKIKASMPHLEQSVNLNGNLKIQIDDMKPYIIPITSRCEIPHIICLKDLINTKTGQQIIKIPIKKNVPSIPFKNCSNINFPFEIKLLCKQDYSKRAYDLIAPPVINVIANQPFFVNLQLKANPLVLTKPKIDIIRKILVLQVQGSKLFFSFLLEAIVYDNQFDSIIS